MNDKQKRMLWRIGITAVWLMALQFIPVQGWLHLALYLVAYGIIGYDILRKAGKGIMNGRIFDENFLMTIATLGAFALAIYEQSGDYLEGIAVMLFYQIGEWFQSYAVGRSRKNIGALMDIRPDYANIERDGKLEKVDPDDVALGTTIVVQPGERVPLDGVVLRGTSSLNTSALTGESLPRDVQQGDEVISGCINMTGVLYVKTTKESEESTVSKILELVEDSSSHKSQSENFITKFAKVYTPAVCLGALALADVALGTTIVVQPGERVPLDGVVLRGTSSLNTSALTGESLPRDVQQGDEVISGCINMTGVLYVKTTKESEESTVSKILELVEDSSSHKSQSENFITKFAKVYTPAVCLGALALAIIPPVIQLMYGHADPQWENWIYRALIFLVISCPCALVISIPLSFFAGIGGASREGILIKGSNYMETLAQTRYIAFDKTGTLTKGNFEVNGVHHNQMEKEELLAYAAMAECASSHPISKSLQQAYGKPIDRNRVRNIHEISGHGVKAAVDGHIVAVGNDKLMKQMKISYVPCHSMGTILHVAVDGRYAGHIVISDVIKPHARQAIAALKRNGIKQTVMLTGDTRRTAENIAKDVGVDQVYSELLPADKVNKVEQLLARKGEKEKLAFVGDGINDAPVLTRADIGIAMGAMGSDAAIEAADVVLMDDDPLQIANAILLSRKCLRIVYENIVFALGIKFLCLGLGAVGIANMWFAIFADVGVMILAILNAIRALYAPSVSIKKDSRKMVLQPQSE